MTVSETVSAAPPAPTTSRQIALDVIRESPTNPRRDFGDLAELEASIRRLGVLQPVLVRPLNGKGTFELVFGHRRFRAAGKAGMTEIPCLVREMDDAQVLEAQLVENCQRHDIHPMDEAEAYEQLHTKHGHAVEDLAAKVGKSKAHVYGRLKLCALCKPARKAFLEDKLSASIALLIARIPDAKLQERATQEITHWGVEGGMPYRQASEHLQRGYMLRLAEAPFSTTDAELVPGAGPCTTCPKRTGNEKLLFPDVRSADVCTDPGCYRKKVDAGWEISKRDALSRGREVLEGKAAEKAFQYGQVSAGFVKLNDRCYEDPKGRNYRDLLRKAKEPVPVLLARDKRGDVHELVRRADAAKALKSAGIKPGRNGTSSGGEASWQKKLREEQAKKRKEAALNQAVVERILETELLDREGRPQLDAWLLVAIGMGRRWWSEDLKAVMKRRGWLPEKVGYGTELAKVFEKHARELIGGNEAFAVRQLHLLMLELVLTSGHMEWKGGSLVAEACELFKVDPKQVAKELPAAGRGGKKSGKPAAAPDEPTCRVCGCTEDAACEGGCSWVEPDLCSACSWVEPDLCSACAEKATPPPEAPAKRKGKAAR